MYFVCNKDSVHIHENASFFLAGTCGQFTGHCDGILIAALRHLEEFQVPKEELNRITMPALLERSGILGLPIRRMGAEESKGKKGVWIGTRENGRRRVYFRCLSCTAINTIDSHLPENIDQDGNVFRCEICHLCQAHQFIRLVGWTDYLAEGGPMKKRGNR